MVKKPRPEDLSCEYTEEIYRSVAFLANCFQAQYSDNMPEDEEVEISCNLEALADMLHDLAPWAELRYERRSGEWVVQEVERSE